MLNLFNRKPTPEFEIPEVGTFYQGVNQRRFHWSKRIDLFSTGEDIDIIIETENAGNPQPGQIAAIQKLTTQYSLIFDALLSYLAEGASNISAEDFKKLYALTEIYLSTNGLQWHFVFEPSIYLPKDRGDFLHVIVEDWKVINFYEH